MTTLLNWCRLHFTSCHVELNLQFTPSQPFPPEGFIYFSFFRPRICYFFAIFAIFPSDDTPLSVFIHRHSSRFSQKKISDFPQNTPSRIHWKPLHYYTHIHIQRKEREKEKKNEPLDREQWPALYSRDRRIRLRRSQVKCWRAILLGCRLMGFWFHFCVTRFLFLFLAFALFNTRPSLARILNRCKRKRERES